MHFLLIMVLQDTNYSKEYDLLYFVPPLPVTEAEATSLALRFRISFVLCFLNYPWHLRAGEKIDKLKVK